MSSKETIDLTTETEAAAPPLVSSGATPAATALKRPAALSDPKAEPSRKNQKKTPAKDCPHVLLWICAAGKGRGKTWKKNALRVIGVYQSKAAAEKKKDELMEEYDCCGHGDIIVGDTWEDEIDLVVRPVEEESL